MTNHAGRAFGKIFDEMGFPLKVAFFLDVPGSWTAYNCDRMREHYGAGKWSKYKWLDNGKDYPDQIMGKRWIYIDRSQGPTEISPAA